MTPRTLAFFFLFAVPVMLQAGPVGRLQGLVRDEAGRTLPGVTVDIHPVAGGADSTVATDGQGAFEATDLAPGRYQVAFRLPSFATTVRTVEVAAGSAARVEATLRVALTADVLVTGRAHVPEPDRPRRARERPARPGGGGLGGRRDRASRSSSGPSSARARSSRRCPASWSASTAARARPTSTTCAASTSTTAPTSRPGSRAPPSTCRRTRTARGTPTTTSSSPSSSRACSTRRARTPPRRATSRPRAPSTSTT